MQGHTQIRSLRLNFGDKARFIRTLIAAPRLTGALAPSGRPLARAMARASGPPPHGLVIELGPGTGPVTAALIEAGVAPKRLVLVEYDPDFCAVLRQRFGRAKILQGDAYNLPDALKKFARQEIAAVVSSLPLLNQPPARREKLIRDAFGLMGREGVFVQFTYGLSSPIPREVCASRYSAVCGARVWRNLPPARVWTYRLEADGSAAPRPGSPERGRKGDAHARRDR